MQTKISKVNTRKAADDGFIKWPSTHLSQQRLFLFLFFLYFFLCLATKTPTKMTKNVAAVAVVRLSCTFDRNIPAFCQNFPSAMSLQDVFFRAPLGATLRASARISSDRQTDNYRRFEAVAVVIV